MGSSGGLSCCGCLIILLLLACLIVALVAAALFFRTRTERRWQGPGQIVYQAEGSSIGYGFLKLPEVAGLARGWVLG
jgi:hypothetical protein